jgi:hypothetical protein
MLVPMSIDLISAGFDSRLAMFCYHEVLAIPGAGVGFVEAVRKAIAVFLTPGDCP